MHRYSAFVNWELWWPQFPVLVYFKETQTKPEGQIHFFPVIFVSPLIYPKFNNFIISYYAIQLNVADTEWPTTVRCYGGACWTFENQRS